MDVGGSLRRIVARWAEALGEHDTNAVGALAEREEASPWAPPWAPPSCGLCGRRLLPGEPLSRFAMDGDVVVVCPVCEPDALLVGYVRLRQPGGRERCSALGAEVVKIEPRPDGDGPLGEGEGRRRASRGAAARDERTRLGTAA